MIEELRTLVAEAEARLGGATSLDSVKQTESEFLGKTSALTAAKRSLGQLEPDERRSAGQTINEIRQRVTPST